LLAVLGVGAVARLVPYLGRPSLSFDETMLSLSIVSRSFSGLLRHLDYGQTAPPLYLWLTHAVTRIAGSNELALRAVPLVAGLLLPLAVWRLSCRLLPQGAALFATLVIALAPGLVQYAGIVKPYAVDALVTVVLIDAALEVRERDDRRAWGLLLVLGVVAVALSTPALFTLAALGGWLLAIRWRTRWAFLTLSVVAWLGLFSAEYVGIYRDAAAGRFMQRFWAADFLTPQAFGLHGRAYGILRNSFLEALLLRPSPVLVATLFCLVALAGLVWLAGRKGRSAPWVLAGPVLMTVLASMFRRYPFSWRLLQFAVPLAGIWLAAGGFAVGEAVKGSRVGRALWWGAAGVIVLSLVAVNVSHPYRTSPVRDLIADWQRRAAPREPVYVFQGAVPAWAFYSTDWTVPDSGWLAALEAVRNTPGADLELERDGRAEIIGHFTGIDWFIGGGATQSHPDSGWAQHEVERMRRRAAGGNVWMLFTQMYRDEAPRLVEAVRAGGGVRAYADSTSGAALYEYRLPVRAPRVTR
jgi:hypothetical protein